MFTVFSTFLSIVRQARSPTTFHQLHGMSTRSGVRNENS